MSSINQSAVLAATLVTVLAWLAPGSSSSQTAGSIQVPITIAHDGLASAGVYNASGELIRSLAYARPVKAGQERLEWDGTTDLGLPAPAGTYQIRGVEFPHPPQIDYIMKAGISGDPPYLTPDPSSGWGSVHGPATNICSNDKNLLAVFEVAESPRETGIQVMDLNGRIQHFYPSFFPFDRRMACAMDSTNFYVAIADDWRPPNRLVIAKYDLDGRPRGKVLLDIPTENHVGTSGYHAGRWLVDVQGMAVQNNRLYVPVTLDDKLVIADTNTAQILSTIPIPSPRGIAAHAGKVYVVSGTSVLPLNDDGTPGKPIVTHLDDPAGLAIDAAGDFYVTDGGAAQQVKVFTPNGKPLRQIGIPGGRSRNGIFNPAGMLDPRGLTVTPDGRVWVTEVAEDYERISSWDTSGKPVKSFYNMHWTSGQGRLSPDRTELLYGARSQEVNAGLTSYEIDLAHGTWQPFWHITQTYDAMDQRDVLLGYKPNTEREQNLFRGHIPYLSLEKDMVHATNGKTYLTGGDYSIYLFDPVTKQARLASLVFTHHVQKTPEGPYQAIYDQGPNTWLTWSDLNGDGRMSLDETTLAQNPPLLDHVPKINSIALQPDLSVLLLAAYSPRSVYVPTRWFVDRLRPVKVLASGVPVYDWSTLEQVTELHIPDFTGGDHDPDRAITRVQLDFMRLANNALYVRLEPSPKVRQHFSGIDGDGWWASRNWRITPEKFDLKTGDPAWLKVGRRAPAHAKPGEMYYPGWGLAGSSHGVDFYADTLSQVWAWTDSGLYLGPVYNDNAGSSVYDANSLFVELIGAYVYDIGDKSYILAGDHGVMVHELKFPTLTPIDGGTVTLTAEASANAKPWDPDGPLPNKRPTYIARSIFNFDKEVLKPTRTITIDGTLNPAEWQDVPTMPILREGRQVGTVQLTFDQTTLYLAYTIEDPNGLKNSGQELPLAPFATGSYVDFDLGPDWSTPNRPEPRDGDLRAILARITGTTPTDYQMGFWPIKQDLRRYTPKGQPFHPQPLHPQDIASPAQQRHFDDIAPIPGLVFAYHLTPTGYTLEASVPFASLGITPTKQPIVGFDASAAFADPQGRVRDRALHWSGETEAAVVDRPGSAELKPQTWGTLQFDLNPLPAVAH